MNDPLDDYRKWRSSLWPLERWALDLAVALAVMTMLLWVTR